MWSPTHLERSGVTQTHASVRPYGLTRAWGDRGDKLSSSRHILEIMPRAPRRPVPRAASPKVTTIVNEIVELGAGRERHVRFRLKAGDVVTATCRAKTKFYSAFLSRVEYTARVGAAGDDTFQFEFGTDVRGFTRRLDVPSDDDYYLVIRDGVFSPKVFVTVEVDLIRRGRVEPTIRSG